MAFANAAVEHFTFESRLSSFQNAHPLAKRRASNASSKAPKSVKWPHKFLSPQELAKAGFFFHPLQANPDNVVCFLCHRALDGWEEGDDPLSEHLKHSPDCGWAIVATIEKQDGELSEEYPLSIGMIEARKATFLDKWPHDSKKGWKCKTKQMVEAGWKYTPTPEYDDMATCTYCSLALDGWEPGDKPMDEHFKRSPDCTFFNLVNNHKQTLKKTKSKRDRTSKASRLSTQSVLTTAADQSMVDLPAEEDDSILTTATTATQTGRKMPKGKKGVAAKGRSTRTKKEEPIEVEEAPEPEDADFEVKIDVAPKPSRGKKRKSDEGHESTLSNIEIEAPPPKRRATRTRGSTAINDSVLPEETLTETAKPKGRKGRPSKAKKNSTVSVVPMDVDVPNDDEIDKALEADLEKHLSDEEKPAPRQKKRATRGSKIIKADHAMFGVEEVHIDEAAIEAELEAMEMLEVESKPLPKAKGAKGKTARKPSAKQQTAAKKAAEAEAAKAAAEEEEEQRVAEEEASLQIVAELEHSISIHHSSPIIQLKKQRATSKRPSKQAPPRATRGSVMSVDDSAVGNVESHVDENRDESGNETDASMASNSTVVRGGSTRRGSTLKKGKGGKKATSRNIEVIINKKASPAAQEVKEIRHPRKGKKAMPLQEISMADEESYKSASDNPMEAITPADEEMDESEPEPELPVINSEPPRSPAKIPQRPQIQQTLTAMMEYTDRNQGSLSSKSKHAKEKSPMRPPPSPTPPPREATPSRSPQSSDAENHPPSSRPSFTTKKTPTPLSAPAIHASTPRTTTTRVPLASTPILSPSKRNIIAGLQSTQPWTAVDLEKVFAKSPTAVGGFGEAVAKAKEGGLTSPEKKMTVEEWILYNANRAEEKLKTECEGMVGLFEREGGRAMRALEGVDCVE